MSAGWPLVLIVASCCAAALIARLAVEPLRGRPHTQCRPYLLLVAAVTALPEAVAPLWSLAAPSPAPAVALVANLLALLALLVAEMLAGGRLLAAAGLDHLLAVVCAAVMTLATGGAILIESTDPLGAPFGHVLSLSLLIACVVHLRWAAVLAPAPRPHNARAPLGFAAPAALVVSGILVAACVLLFARLLHAPPGDPATTLGVAALAAAPELAVLVHALRRGRPDVACAVVLGGVILNLSSMAVADLLQVRAAAYRFDSVGALLIVAAASAAILVALGLRLLRE